MKKFVLLDRDGVINKRIKDGYVTSWDQFVFLPAALDALRLLNENGYAAIVVSNQACVGKGLISTFELEGITRRFVEEVGKHRGRIHAVYYCTHREEDACDCRKPKPGLLLKAQKDHRFSFAETFLIGDSETDLQTAHEVGCRALLISEGASETPSGLSQPPCGILPNLYWAARFILGQTPAGYDICSPAISPRNFGTR